MSRPGELAAYSRFPHEQQRRLVRLDKAGKRIQNARALLANTRAPHGTEPDADLERLRDKAGAALRDAADAVSALEERLEGTGPR